jgi:hypothetical protein
MTNDEGVEHNMDMTYVGESEGGTFDLFHFLSDGNRPVLEILVSKEDNSIWVAGIDTTYILTTLPQRTKGVAHRHPLETDGVTFGEYVCMESVLVYILPRIVTMMARVYCPKDSTQVTLNPNTIKNAEHPTPSGDA